MYKAIIIRIVGIVLLLISGTATFSQTITQTIRGRVTDRDTKISLVGVNVLIVGANPPVGTITDENGNFRLTGIPVGRIDIKLSYIGYEEIIIPNVLVNSGKEVILEPEMQESLVEIDEVKVTARKNKAEVLNEMALISSRSFSVEETKRYAGSFNDPSRMVSAYAGVTSDPEGNNDIIVRGNSPKGILWRLEGVDIPNPNHFANEGATGGPISALNSDMLSNSDFYTGAFSPEYGNALSGVFDMKLRSGNNEKREYSLGLGVLGTDMTLEGPFKKGYAGSYLINYRYSSLALLDKAGLVDYEGIPKYQDLCFKFNMPTRNIGTFSVFGLGGISHIYQTEKYHSDSVVLNNDYGARLGVIGLNHIFSFDDGAYVKTSLSVSRNGSSYDENDKDEDTTYNYKGNWYKSAFKASTTLSKKIDVKNRVLVGVSYTNNYYNLKENGWDNDIKKQVNYVDVKKDAGLVQAYTCWKYRLSSNITFVSGAHYMNFLLNHHFSLEPRISLKWQINGKQSINAGFGIHSKLENIYTYYAIVRNKDGQEETPNKNLDFTKARHYVIGYEYRINENLNAKLEAYYQDLYNVPVENVDTSYYSILNSDEGSIDKAMVNKGTGKNYGIELTLERFYNKNYYFLLTSSLYNSRYKSLENVERNTKFNGNYAVNLLIGKEFNVGSKLKSKVLGINMKFYFMGGRRYEPLNLEESIVKEESVYYNDKAYNNKLDDIFQMNLSITYRINRPKAGHEFIIDVANMTNNQARIEEYYDKYAKERKYDYQLNMLPNIMYRIHF
jgi:hypothetical protein